MKQSVHIVFVLHTHLPYVLNHGNWPHGSDWLCEAVAECYIPLLNMCNELLSDGIKPNLSIDISPVLCEQLEHPDFAAIFIEYCSTKMRLALDDAAIFVERNADPHQAYLAHYWHEWYAQRKLDFQLTYNQSIIVALKNLQDQHAIEILTCAATHGYFPLLAEDKSIRLQMKTAIANYSKHFGQNPKGTWIPECGYRPAYEWKTLLPSEKYSIPTSRLGIDEILAQEGIKYFMVDQHLFSNAEIHSRFPMHALPQEYHSLRNFRVKSRLGTINDSTMAFARHQQIALQVWSGDTGYPGDGNYLDFHKKHEQSAMRYWRVTDSKSDMQYKMLYVPAWINEKISLHAYHFVKSIESIIHNYHNSSGKQGVICLPFDTELFGHWWFEGPQFLNAVLRGLYHSPFAETVIASDHLSSLQDVETASLPEGSWGKNGNHDVWMNPETMWTWEKIYLAEERFDILMNTYSQDKRSTIQQRILLQVMKELLLLQSSDWQFLITNLSAKDYAEMRFSNHYSDFNLLADLVEKYNNLKRLSVADHKIIQEIEERDAVFKEINLDFWTD